MVAHGAPARRQGASSTARSPSRTRASTCSSTTATSSVFSGHKIFAPTGVGVVYGKADVLEHMPPWQGGGNMIKDVHLRKDDLQRAAREVRGRHRHDRRRRRPGRRPRLRHAHRHRRTSPRTSTSCLTTAPRSCGAFPGCGSSARRAEKAGVLSFVLDGYRTEDVGAALAREGIAVRAGHHCAQPISPPVRDRAAFVPSLAFYNTCEEIDASPPRCGD